MLHAVLSALVLGAANTAGDMLWAGLSLRHRMGYGLAHGALLCLLVGGMIGWRARRTAPALLAGPFIGVIAASVFYLLVRWLRYYAMFPAWMVLWICFALLQKRLRRDMGWTGAVARGLIAAGASGLAFYAISGIWTSPPRGGPNYLYNFGAWTFAFFPGFAALFVGGTRLDQRP